MHDMDMDLLKVHQMIVLIIILPATFGVNNRIEGFRIGTL